MKAFEYVIAYIQQHRDVYGNIEWATLPEWTSHMESALQSQNPEGDLLTPGTKADERDWTTTENLADLNGAICTCMKCPLGATRTSFVFGSGNESAEVMVVGEAPGADEDAQGLPFVGRAGQLLTKILESIQLQRSDVYICNILKCRPPNNRKPTPQETDSCEPYLWKQIELVQPRYILALGLTAAHTLLKTKHSMSALRGTVHDYHGIGTVVTYHPAALLRNPAWKKETWEDVKFLRSLLDQTIQ